ncbi:hypothetical protein Nepgr_029511 [Nepenthes gracilis]|uniref:RRM domain-containing protein n=1 Tax=Nepenthes gracilis TaxID=150966 RepID=A0AAD3TED8_NEPGR|nr:hypothetical protein Nepgr_029511 [Nepenthes gracilis]
MGESSSVRFLGDLDPEAQEFWPGYPTQFPLMLPETQVYYPYNPAPPPVYHRASPPPVHHHDAYPAPYDQSLLPLSPRLPPPSSTPTRALLLSSVPTEVSESTLRRELEVFGDVRAVQMERVREGIVTVHFYDLRASHAAMEEIRAQHMQHQNRLRIHYMTTGLFLARSGNGYPLACGLDIMGPPPPPLPPPARGLISGRAVWAQFMIPAINAFPDGHNQGTLVVFNLDSQISANTLKELFEAFGPVRELRETPLKKHQRFVEFYDVRDAASALAEMNGKEIYGKNVMIEFSRPGGHGKRFFSSSGQHHSYHCSTTRRETAPHSTLPQVTPSPPPSYSGRILRGAVSNFSRRANSRQSQPSMMKRFSSSTTRNEHRKICSSEPVEALMAGLTLRALTEERESSSEQVTKNVEKLGSSSNKNNGSSSASSSSELQQQNHQHLIKNRAHCKGKRKNFEPRFLIKAEAIVESSCRDRRTTIMIKNIPNKYSQKLLLNMLDNHCIHCNEHIADGDDQPLSSYDFLYLPIDFNNKCNVGYGFVNMTSPEATLRLYKAFHKQHWEVFNSRKICEVTYARVQGLQALKDHFKNSKFACDTEEYLPVVFSPPRDGRRSLTFPLPIVTLCHVSPASSIAADQEVVNDDDGGMDGADSTTASTGSRGGDFLINHENDSTHCGHDHDGSGGGGGLIASSSKGGDIIHEYYHSNSSSNSSSQ